jgi:hypothetical protein
MRQDTREEKGGRQRGTMKKIDPLFSSLLSLSLLPIDKTGKTKPSQWIMSVDQTNDPSQTRPLLLAQRRLDS